ncbi:helix-turn-helix transcriptional regulator [Amycolatopsis orientalis]|uniref:helix-turn-helix transcriptional regulator n=1 Tax=Amycolatopsis orientalis TaxID=31958 RepID=UPI001F2F4090|nr:response regulator transcription factor [Amycolatopsis orientalis]
MLDRIPLVHLSVKVLVAGVDDLCWTWSSTNREAASREAATRRPDILLIESGIAVGWARHTAGATSKLAGTVVALVGAVDHVDRLADVGIRHMIPRTVHPKDFANLVRRAHCGDPLIPAEMRTPSGNDPCAPQVDWTPASLTEQQLRVLQLIGGGLNNNEIAKRLSVSQETVRTHTKNIYRTLHVRNRAHAITVAYAQGIMRPVLR